MSFITILIPLYNGIEYLEECINSVIIQTFTDWKVIIGINGHGVNGGHVVSIVDQISKKDSRISYIIQPPPLKGKVESLNNLITLTSSPWISILDCDDIWEYYKLERQVDALNSDAKDASVIGTFARIFTLKSKHDYLTLPHGYIDPNTLTLFNPIVNSSSLIKRELCRWEYNKYTGNANEDYWLWMEICLKGGKLYNISEYLTWHRIHETSAFNSKGHSNEQLRNHYISLINN
jgi:alpha-1,3-rhamnosyltransferase